jgi:hypothetical protein
MKTSCIDHTPSWFVGHWRDWHRGHGCDKDDGKLRSDRAKTEIAQHAANADTGYLTDAELGFLRASTTSGDERLVRALDELATRRRNSSVGVIDVSVVEIRPHPDQATNNPGCWAVKLGVSYDGSKRTFWRWHTVREVQDGRYVAASNEKKPTTDEILTWFWGDTFAELHGFSFNKDDP